MRVNDGLPDRLVEIGGRIVLLTRFPLCVLVDGQLKCAGLQDEVNEVSQPNTRY